MVLGRRIAESYLGCLESRTAVPTATASADFLSRRCSARPRYFWVRGVDQARSPWHRKWLDRRRWPRNFASGQQGRSSDRFSQVLNSNSTSTFAILYAYNFCIEVRISATQIVQAITAGDFSLTASARDIADTNF
jgi:hypothetical protein